MKIPFARHSYTLDSLPASAQRCVNLFAEIQPEDARVPFILRSAPGTVEFAEMGDGPIRGIAWLGADLIVISGVKVYRLTAAGSSFYLGSMSADGAFSLAGGLGYVVMVDSPRAYYTDGAAVTEITDDDFPGASSVGYLDGYWIFTRPDSGQFFISSLLDPSAFESLDFATAEGAPDDTLRVLVDHREVWLFGARTTEIWVNTGVSPFPLERMGNAFIERGIGAPFSAAKLDNTVFWMGDDGIVYRAEGYVPRRISTHAIEQAIERYDRRDDAEGWTYTQDGHVFYVLSFPTAEVTWVYDGATQLWHERISGAKDHGLWRACCGVTAFGKVLVGDRSTGKVFALDPTAHDEAGGVLRRLAHSAPVRADGGARSTMSLLQMDIETGVGLIDGQGENPQAMLQWSDDGGRTWSNERWVSIGGIGAYKARARWTRLGSFRERVLRLAISDPVSVTIYQAEANVTRGVS
ncbi:hypothetical protein L2U69_11820 [Zavarzinia compransoris]|uniref:hypothetical protein n=1 Tax=Zavarzinia marina TaxID=2911065 RepID=UPI001F3BBEED|nr:hypothetical protein [Zavarzinia marina]MCF4166334.1 hypothetical protein [Zavarzinia marina]